MIKETLFALVMVFNQGPTEWQEMTYAENISFEQCDTAQRAIWSQDWEIVGYDESGALPEVDAYCISMETLDTAEFSGVIR